MAALDLKDLKLLEHGLDDVGDAFEDIGDKAKDASKEVEEFEKRIQALLIKANPMPRLVKDINDQLSRQADQMRQTLRAVDELSRAYDRLAKAQSGMKPAGLKQGPKFGSAAKPAIDKSSMELSEPAEPTRLEVPRGRPKTSVAGGLSKSEAEALGGSTIDAIAALAKGDEPLKVIIDLGKDVAKTFLNASVEGISLGTELKRMGVSAGVIRVIGSDAAAAKAGLSAATAATGELAAANVAMGEAAAAAGAAEAVAIAPLGVVLAGVALAAAAVGAVFAVSAQQIGKSAGENLDHLHLTEEQLARVKDKGVTMGDVLSGVWKTTTDMLQETFGPALKWLGDLFGKIYQGAVDGVLWAVKSNVQAIGGFLGGFKAAFSDLGPAIADLVISGLNLAGGAVQKLVNMAIDAINRLTRMGNGAAEKLGLSIRLPELNAISLDPIENKFAGRAAAMGKDISRGITSGAEEAGKAYDALGARIVKNVVKARDARVVKEAGEDVKKAADAACNCGSNVQNVANDNRSYRSSGPSRDYSDVTYREPVSLIPDPTIPQEKLEPIKPFADETIKTFADPVAEQFDKLIAKMTELNELAPQLGKQLEGAFGKSGKAMSSVLTSFSAYTLEVAKLDKEGGLNPTAEQQQKRTETAVKGYANMAGAAKGFFKEHSTGYAAMESIERAYRVWQAASTIRAMAMDMAATTQGVANSAARGVAAAASGAAKIFEELGPWGFPIVAAMVGVLASLGLHTGGGGAAPGANDMKTRQDAQGTGSVLGDSKAKSDSLEKALTHAQAYENKDLEYGAAMVRSLKSIDDQIGAVAAALARSFAAGGMLSAEGLNLGKSGSAPTLSNLGFSKSTTRTLQDQGVQFVAATLSDIVAGGLTGSTYQQVLETTKKKAFGITTSNKSKVVTETGALDADFLAQVTKLIGSLGAGVGEAAKALKATGVEAALANFKVDLGKLSFKDMTGAQIEEALNAIFGKLGDDMAKAAVPAIAQFQKVGEGAFETLVRVARQYEVIDTTLKSVGMTFGAVGVASLSARERLVDLVGGLDNLTSQTAFFAEHFLTEPERLKPVQDSVAAELKRLGQPADLSRQGFKDLVLRQDLSTEEGAKLYAALMALAPAFDKVAAAAETARRAVEDKKASILDQIDDLVLSPAEQLAKSRAKEMEAVKALDASLAPFLETLWKAQDAAEAAKLAADRSNLFADLLDAQGRSEEAKALRRANALAAIKDPVQQDYQQRIWAAEDAAAKVSAARDVLTEAYQREHDAIQATKDKFEELSKSLRAFSASLSDTLAGADPASRYRTTRQTFLTTASLARLGDADAMGRLQSEGEAFTAASRDYVSTSLDYLRDVGLVRSAVDEAADTADRQVSIAEQQLKALDASVQGLIQINTSVISVREAISNLRGALAGANAAGVASVGGSGLGLTGGGATGSPVSDTRTLDGKYHYDSFIGGIAYTESLRDPAFYAAHGIPFEVMTPGTQAYSTLQTFKVRDKDQYDYLEHIRNLQGFATGGGFEVGGSGPPDSKFFGLALSPGEAVNVRRRGEGGDETLVNELRRLREELADLRQTSARIATSNDKMERTLTNVTEGGRAMQTQAAA